jgi:hypothetical protein
LLDPDLPLNCSRGQSGEPRRAGPEAKMLLGNEAAHLADMLDGEQKT